MAGSKRRKGPTFSMVNEVLDKQKENNAKDKAKNQVNKSKKKHVKKNKVSYTKQQDNTDKVLEDIKQARIKFKETIKQIAKRKSEIEKKTEWHYQMKEAAENDRNSRYQYAHIVSASLSKNKTIEER